MRYVTRVGADETSVGRVGRIWVFFFGGHLALRREFVIEREFVLSV
jgi:hypothetical protein